MKLIVRSLYLMFFLVQLSYVSASDIKIGLFYEQEIQSAVFTVVRGEYILMGDGRRIASVGEGSIFHLDCTQDRITVQSTTDAFGTFENIELRGISSENVFMIKPVYPSLQARESDDDLLIETAYKKLRIINRLDLEKYIAGTIEAEGGADAAFEYYKAQAILVRTYAVKNFNRHAYEGFNLCDGQHCQAFNGKSRWNKEIYEAVLATKDEVLTDTQGQLAEVAYHANCGGVTSSASMAWNDDLPYLVPIQDPFCSESKNHQWTKRIPVNEWKQYLLKRGIGYALIPDNQTDHPTRLKYFVFDDRRILLTDMRTDFNLKSAFFSISQQDNDIVLSGYGYGHGVGLCQEGAMEMARVGYVYVDILMFYFRNLTLSQYTSRVKEE